MVTPGVKEDSDATNYDANLVDEKDAMELMHNGESENLEPVAVIDIKMADDRKINDLMMFLRFTMLCPTQRYMAFIRNALLQLKMVGDVSPTTLTPSLVDPRGS